MRTIVRPAQPANIPEGADRRFSAEPAPMPDRRIAFTAAGAPADTYASKLVKYVPAEVIAFYVPAYALMGKTAAGAAATLAVGAIATFAYLEWQARREDQKQPWSFYALAVLAFLGWALGISTVGTLLFGLTIEVSAFIMMVLVLAIPAVDGLTAPVREEKMIPTA